MFSSGCGSSENEIKYEELDNIETKGDYNFIGNAGLRINNENYSFVEEIEKQVKADGHKLYSSTGYLDSYKLVDDKMFFTYKYYWSGDVEKDYLKTTQNYVFGYFDYKNVSLIILDYFEEVNAGEVCKIVNVFGDSAFITIGSDPIIHENNYQAVFIEYDILIKSVEREYNITHKVKNSYSGNTIAIQTSDTYIIFRNENKTSKKYYLNLITNTYIYFVYEDYVILTNYGEIISADNKHYGYNFITKDKTSNNFVDKTIDSYINQTYDFKTYYTFEGTLYIIDKVADQLVFTNTSSEEVTTISTEEVKVLSSEYKEITEIFGKDCYFDKVIVQEDKLFIILRNKNSNSGVYEGGVPSLVFSYDVETLEMSYLGYYGFVYDDVYLIY